MALGLLLARDGVTLPQGARGLVWLGTLTVLFAAFEGFVVHMRVRRGAHAFSLTEIPMVLGLLSLNPLLVVLARVAGGGAGLLVLRRQRGLKLVFNVALVAAQSVVAAWVFHRLGGDLAGVSGLGVRQLVAVYSAMILADVVAAVAVTAVIALHDDPGEWRRLPSALRGTVVAAGLTTIGVVGAEAASQSPWSVSLLVVLCVVLLLVYRALVRQGNDRAEVGELYAFTTALDGAAELDEVLPVVLDRVRDQLRADVAEIVLTGPDGPPRVARMSGPGVVTDAEVPPFAWYLPALRGEPVRTGNVEGTVAGAEPVDGAAVPLPLGEATGALVVRGSLPDSGGFTDDRLGLLRAMANHAGVALGKAQLLDRLRREAAEKEHLALHDTLSGLPNRRHFLRLVDDALAGGGGSGAVLLLDVDRFKEVNDALGHDIGDALLTEVAQRLRAHVEGIGVAARLGGDEFAVWLPTDGTIEAGLARGAELSEKLEQTMPIGPLTIDLRASVGVAVAPLHGTDAHTLVRHADVAMYAAKETRAGLRAYDETADVNTPQRLARIADLRAAIDRRDLMVAFQPKVDPATGAVVGAEALARWHHPADGMVPPDEFIPLAEHSGLIRPLTLHMLEVALRSRAAWARTGHDLHVAVNLSPNGLLDVTLPEVVERLLAQTGSAPASLTLEITESSIMADPSGSLATLERLHALGVKLSIDDFGTGYSSLGRLRRLPIHEVKIDRSFVQRLTHDHRDRAVVRSAVQLGHALGLEVVAEGVEDAGALELLAREGCDLVQGYFVSRPLAPDAFTEWLTGQPVHERRPA
nr:sensor domain-containing phosphodiesterase [Spirilliplanes yamanashiensis]